MNQFTLIFFFSLFTYFIGLSQKALEKDIILKIDGDIVYENIKNFKLSFTQQDSTQIIKTDYYPGSLVIPEKISNLLSFNKYYDLDVEFEFQPLTGENQIFEFTIDNSWLSYKFLIIDIYTLKNNKKRFRKFRCKKDYLFDIHFEGYSIFDTCN